jgi:predicted metal-dependent hydrolase
MRDDLRDAFCDGVRLFNEGHYWHAHEQWERCWLASSGQDAVFYKAIIQAAAALVKWQQGNPRGLRRNWAKSRARLDTLPASLHGIDLAALRAALDALAAGAPVAPPALTPPAADPPAH